MFHKKEASDQTSYTYVDTSMSALPEDVAQENKQTLEQLLEIVKLLSQKFGLKNDVSGRVANNNKDSADIVLFNGTHGTQDSNVDDENKRPIEYLMAHGGQVGKEKSQYSYWSNSIVKLETSRLKDVVEGLKLLTAQNDDQPRLRAMARC